MGTSIITPIFILGAQHSGTSILQKMLGQHPDICWFSQLSRRGGDVSGRFKIPFHGQLNRILRSIFPHSWQKKDSRFKEFFVPRPGAADQIWEYIFPDEEVVEDSKERLKKVLEAECRDWGKNFILLRLQELSRHIPTLLEVCPQAKFIHIVRDGRSQAISIKAEFMKDNEPEIEGLKRSAKNWIEMIDKIRRHKERANILELRYEDFCQDVHGWLSKLLDHVGLEKKKFPFNKCPKTLISTNSQRILTATPDEIAAIETVEREYLKIYGYLNNQYLP